MACEAEQAAVNAALVVKNEALLDYAEKELALTAATQAQQTAQTLRDAASIAALAAVEVYDAAVAALTACQSQGGEQGLKNHGEPTP